MSDNPAGAGALQSIIAECRNPTDDRPAPRSSFWASLAVWAARNLPRGKGAVPRWIGHNLIGERRYTLPGRDGLKYVGDGAAMEALCYYQRDDTVGHDVVAICESLLEEGEVFYDLGANVGHVSLSVAKARPDAKVITFEPLPALARSISAACRENGLDNVDLFAAALDTEPGHQTFYLPPYTAHASFVAREVAGVQALKIPTLSLDALVTAAEIPPPDVIKLDVEGAEMRLLDGAEQTFRQHQPALFFECDANAARFGHGTGDMLERLAGLGYTRFFKVKGVVRTEVAVGDNPPYGDFLAVGPAKENRLARLPG